VENLILTFKAKVQAFKVDLRSASTYLLVGVFCALNSNDLSGGLKLLLAVLNELGLESRIVFNVCRLIDAALDIAGS
jgi:hypothetical protein